MINLSLNRRIELIEASSIERYTLYESGHFTYAIKDGASWTTLPTGTHRPQISVKPTKSDAGIIYNIDATVRIPLSLATDTLLQTLRRMRRVVARYQKTDGPWLFLGTPLFYLDLTLERIEADEAGSFFGYEVKLTGKTHFDQRFAVSS